MISYCNCDTFEIQIKENIYNIVLKCNTRVASSVQQDYVKQWKGEERTSHESSHNIGVTTERKNEGKN